MNEDSSVSKKKLLSLALILAALFLAISPLASASVPDGQGQRRATHRRTAKRRKRARAQMVTYTCPMHHDVHLQSPGDCPKCGMELEAEKRGR
jgi:heavy metal-binding protein